MERLPQLCEQVPALAGHNIGITADRRAAEQGELLRRMGAEVSYGPVLRTLPLGDDTPMRAATATMIAEPPTLVLLTTGIGLRSWVGAAEGWGLADELLDVLASVPIHARGPKAYAAALQYGLTVWRREPTEQLEAMVATLAEQRLDDQHIVLQLYGNDAPWAIKTLEEAGARVTPVPIYRWVPPEDEGPARRLVRETLDGQLTVVTFTSPSAVASICRIAESEQSLDALLTAFRTRVAAACVGPVTARCRPRSRDRSGLRPRRGAARSPRPLARRCAARPPRPPRRTGGAPRGPGWPRDRRRASGSPCPTASARCSACWPHGPGGSSRARSSSARCGCRPTRTAHSTPCSPGCAAAWPPPGLEIATRVRRGYQLLADPVPCDREP